MREMVEYIVKQIVDNPEEVKVEEIKTEKIILLEVSVAKEDMGKVIGKGGRIATALRTLLGAAAAKLKKRAMLEILEERTSTMEQ
ncbi:hypothetical protein LCGC14_1458100 [marine sediment metagenome]|jgi:predicted RNA-binding protein YlqC (UPF0109 family)|uniref:Uncharacterized protein n=1 Tax=marine sediment metagenome TaxID=412755 RepID=A0A0F9K207_9ZZZZ|nr:KH domain-containing protein [Clostridia bacterium]